MGTAGRFREGSTRQKVLGKKKVYPTQRQNPGIPFPRIVEMPGVIDSKKTITGQELE